MVVVDKEIGGSDKVERGDEEPEERTDPCREKRQSRQHSRCFSLSTSSWAMSRACYGSVFMRCPNSNRCVDSKRSELSPRCIASASSGFVFISQCRKVEIRRERGKAVRRIGADVYKVFDVYTSLVPSSPFPPSVLPSPSQAFRESGIKRESSSLRKSKIPQICSTPSLKIALPSFRLQACR